MYTHLIALLIALITMNPNHSRISQPVPNPVAYADACRTAYVWPHTGGIDAYEGIGCSDSTPASTDARQDNDDEPETPAIVTTIETPATMTTIVTTSTATETPEAPASTTTIKGNPGNDSPVGNAGEKCDKDMCENTDGTTGEHGKSKND